MVANDDSIDNRMSCIVNLLVRETSACRGGAPGDGAPGDGAPRDGAPRVGTLGEVLRG